MHKIEIHKSNRILLRYRKIYYSAIRLVNYNVLLLDIHEKLNSCELPANDAIYARKNSIRKYSHFKISKFN